ncbi:unnamed protein product, partial [Amoebophrya sp. A120]
ESCSDGGSGEERKEKHTKEPKSTKKRKRKCHGLQAADARNARTGDVVGQHRHCSIENGAAAATPLAQDVGKMQDRKEQGDPVVSPFLSRSCWWKTRSWWNRCFARCFSAKQYSHLEEEAELDLDEDRKLNCAAGLTTKKSRPATTLRQHDVRHTGGGGERNCSLDEEVLVERYPNRRFKYGQ